MVVWQDSSLRFWVWGEVSHEVQELRCDVPVEVAAGKWVLVEPSSQLRQNLGP